MKLSKSDAKVRDKHVEKIRKAQLALEAEILDFNAKLSEIVVPSLLAAERLNKAIAKARDWRDELGDRVLREAEPGTAYDAVGGFEYELQAVEVEMPEDVEAPYVTAAEILESMENEVGEA